MKLPRSLMAVLPLLGWPLDYGLENNNILSYDQAQQGKDYNRLRLESTVRPQDNPALVGRLIIDNESSYQYLQRSLVNETSIYRAYLEYRGEKHFWVAGRQRVPFGVGRVWNPVDVFNPIDSFSIETAERKGTEALRYEYAVSDLANFDLTVAKEKSAARIKGFMRHADLALLAVYDNENDRDLIGYEAAGELLDTGIELRSEGGRFHDRRRGGCFTEFILGAEYGFANSFSLLGEYRYNDESKVDYWATSLGYQATPLLALRLLNIVNLDDHSHFTTPSFVYSLSDEMSLACGALFYDGGKDDEFGGVSDRYFLNWYVHF
ncbi:MAG: hypothetical protein OEY01_13035 [Desulfobulbaceae bacterium]|nr:hypothetical protein [Desulfobulbaceae bacterium]HIJ79654.1 hypothetical protein [Deltaproteobacteria bacterium]